MPTPVILVGVNGTTASAIENLFETVARMFSRADTLAQPDALVAHLKALSVVWAVVFLIAGTLCLLSGYKFYKNLLNKELLFQTYLYIQGLYNLKKDPHPFLVFEISIYFHLNNS